jgi:hypothetical protein
MVEANMDAYRIMFDRPPEDWFGPLSFEDAALRFEAPLALLSIDLATTSILAIGGQGIISRDWYPAAAQMWAVNEAAKYPSTSRHLRLRQQLDLFRDGR